MTETSLDVIARRFAVLERAWFGKASTPTVNAGFASLAAAIANAKLRREAYLTGPWTATPTDPLAQVIPLHPETITERTVPVVSVTAADAVVSPKLTCPLCRIEADRAHVEQYGRCYDCALLAPAPATKLSPASADPAREQSPASAPPAPGDERPVAGSTGAGAAVREGSAPQ